MASPARPLLLAVATPSMTPGMRATQYGPRIVSKGMECSFQRLQIAACQTRSPFSRARTSPLTPAAPGHSRPFSAVASPTGPTGDNVVPELPEPRRPDKHDRIFAHELSRRPSLPQTPKAYYEADEYAGNAGIRSNLFSSGPDAALRTYLLRPSGSDLLAVSTIHHFVRALLTPTKEGLPVPTPCRITAATFVLTDQLEYHLRQPGRMPPGFDTIMITAMRVLAALSSSVAVRRRWQYAHGILELMLQGRFPVHNRFPGRIPTAAACYGSDSHAGAITALSRDTRLSPDDWKAAIGMLGKIRFDARSFLSVEDFSRFLQLYEARGTVVDTELFVSYVKALTTVVAYVRRPEEGKMLNRLVTERRIVLKDIRNALHVLELEILPRYPAVSHARLCLPLLNLYLHLPHQDTDIFRCWNAIMHAPPFVRGRAARVIAGFPLDAVSRLWEDVLTTESPGPTDDDWNAFFRALKRRGAYAEAVRAVAKRVYEDPSGYLLADEIAEERVTALLEHIPLPASRIQRILHYITRAPAHLLLDTIPISS